MEALFRSESWIAIVMITDLLGRKDRFNVPGTAAKSNWSRRMPKTVADLDASPAIRKRMGFIRELLEKTGEVILSGAQRSRTRISTDALDIPRVLDFARDYIRVHLWLNKS